MMMHRDFEALLLKMGDSPSLECYERFPEHEDLRKSILTEAKEKFGVSLQYVDRNTWVALYKRAERSFLAALEQAIIHNDNKTYVVLVTEGMFLPAKKKSGDWLAGCFLKRHRQTLSDMAATAGKSVLVNAIDISEGHAAGREWSKARAEELLLKARSEGATVRYLIFDDAAYGGNQKSRAVRTLAGWSGSAQCLPNDCHVHVVLPVASELAMGTISDIDANCHIHHGDIMWANNQALYGDRLPYQTPSVTFLFHKVPDDKSFPDEVAKFILKRDPSLAVTPYMSADASWWAEPTLEVLMKL